MVSLPLRSSVALLLALLVLVPAACGPGGTPRRDLVLVLADSSDGAGPAYLARRAEGLALRGGLRRDATPLPTPLELRIELYTSRRDEGFLEEVHPPLPHLPSAVNRSGRASFGLSTPTGLVPERGFDPAFEVPGQPESRALRRLAADELAPALRAGLDELDADTGADRPPAFVLADLAGAEPAELDALLTALAPELDAAHLFVYFTDPTSPDRMLLAGPGLPKGERNAAVDPRDLFPTVAILARVPVPGTVQGVDLLAD